MIGGSVGGGKPLPFELKKFCQVRTLAERWDCSAGRIYDLMSKGVLKAWHPEKKTSGKGVMAEVASALEAERGGYAFRDS